LSGTQPSILLHPLDFLGREDAPELGFFPAMGLPAEKKLRLVDGVLGRLAHHYRIVPLGVHARELAAGPALPGRVWV